MFIHWFHAIRLKTLSASVAPIMLSQVLAYQINAGFSFYLALIIMSCALLLQISVNLANDYFDAKAGIDDHHRLGPQRAMQSGWVTAGQMKRAIWLCLGGAIICGLYLVAQGGALFLLLGLLCIGGVLGYSGGPKPLASHALGEVAVFLFFGPLAVLGGFYLQLDDQVLGASELSQLINYATQMGLWAAAIMLVNNIRDIETDARANKNTLAVLLGRPRSQFLYSIFLAAVLILALLNEQPIWQIVIGGLLCAFLARSMYTREKTALNKQLAQSAAGLLLWSVFCVASVLS